MDAAIRAVGCQVRPNLKPDGANSGRSLQRRFPGLWLLAGLLFLGTFSLYLPCLAGGFLNLDDISYLTALPTLTFRSILRLFSEPREGYQPFALLTLAMEHRVAAYNPWLYHFTNVLFHCLNTLLVTLLIRRIFGNLLVGLIAGVFFAVHPVHVEAVAWIASRKDVQYACFYLFGLYVYAEHVHKGGAGWFRPLMVSLCFLAALLSKGMAVSFPLALFCVDFAMGRRWTDRRALLEKIPFFALALAFGMFSVHAQQSGGFIAELERQRPLATRLVYAGYGLGLHLWHTIFPFDLSGFYPYPDQLPAGHGAQPAIVCVIVGLVLISAGWVGRRSRAFVFCMALFLVCIAFVLQIVPVADFLLADRYNYLSSVGFCALLGLLVRRSLDFQRHARVAILTVLGCVAILYAAETRRACSTWQDSLTLWTDVLRKFPASTFALNMRGGAWIEDGAYRPALADFDEAIRLQPGYGRSYVNRGFVRYKRGDPAGAIADYDTAILLNPRDMLAYNNRGLVRLQQGDAAAAALDFGNAVALGAATAYAPLFYVNRSEARNRIGDPVGALADALAARDLRPSQVAAYVQAAHARLRVGDPAGAMSEYRQALDYQPMNADLWKGLADAAGKAGATQIASQAASHALELEKTRQLVH